MTLRTLNYGNYGIFLIMGNAGFCPSAVSTTTCKICLKLSLAPMCALMQSLLSLLLSAGSPVATFVLETSPGAAAAFEVDSRFLSNTLLPVLV